MNFIYLKNVPVAQQCSVCMIDYIKNLISRQHTKKKDFFPFFYYIILCSVGILMYVFMYSIIKIDSNVKARGGSTTTAYALQLNKIFYSQSIYIGTP